MDCVESVAGWEQILNESAKGNPLAADCKDHAKVGCHGPTANSGGLALCLQASSANGCNDYAGISVDLFSEVAKAFPHQGDRLQVSVVRCGPTGSFAAEFARHSTT